MPVVLPQPDLAPSPVQPQPVPRVVDPLRIPGWDDLIAVFSEATPFHTAAWARVLHRTYGHTPLYVVWDAESRSQKSEVRGQRSAGSSQTAEQVQSNVLTSDGSSSPQSAIRYPLSEPGSALPLMELRGLFRGRRGVALPFTDSCPALGGPQDHRTTDHKTNGPQLPAPNSDGSSCPLSAIRYPLSEGMTADHRSPLHPQYQILNPQSSILNPESPLWSTLLALARSRRWRWLELRGGLPPTLDATPSQTFYTHTLDLTRGPDALFAGCSPSTRRAVRKAEQAGLKVEISHTMDALHDFYALHSRTRRKHGLPPQPFSFFLALHDEIISRGQGFIAVARQALRPLAAAVFLVFGECAVFKYGASDDTVLPLRANNLAMWEAIRHLATQGFARLDFGRTSTSQDGLRRFKLGWGTREQPLFYYRYDLCTDRFVTVTDRAHGWYNQLFAQLPLTANRILGGVLYKHLD